MLCQVPRPHGSKRSQPSCRKPQHLPVGLGVDCLKLQKADREFRVPTSQARDLTLGAAL
ncbi:Hypothetical predicted protein [Podarcis lilfordi]|uniref:Uncharacterized protein n=1 Tax=Podarcis lilfordi TaxID=74358 RepID=A0AA35LNF6_9SAUR|nr:Hypothetical predicted protein [Podarcis lilfordi]